MGEKTTTKRSPSRSLVARIGPGLITACVVIGPGSLLASSKIGANYDYSLLWVLVIAVVLMGVFMTLGVRLGAIADATPAEILARRFGRWFPALIGLSIFFVAASFQFGNNLGAASAFGTFIHSETNFRPAILVGLTFVLNSLAITFLFAFKDLYRALERLMTLFVSVMLVAFLLNLILAGVDVIELVKGFIPLQGMIFGGADEQASVPRLDLVVVIAWIGTTFIPAIAYYQPYLVRQKGWNESNLRDGLVDARIGAAILATITLMIVCTAARVLEEEPQNIESVANQLKPLFGTLGQIIFCVGLFSAAYSSFLVNSMIGGFMLADGLGLGSKPSDRMPRVFTVAVLVIGWLVGSYTILMEVTPIGAIVFAQAVTVLGGPLIGVVLWWLTSQRSIMREHANGKATHVIAAFGVIVLLAFSIYLISRIVSTLSG